MRAVIFHISYPLIALLLCTNALADKKTAIAGHAIDQNATYTISGLSKPAEIIVDKWGIPHIYANDHYDAFFVQGFNAARDRLWQIDLWRKRGLGQLSGDFGAEYLEQDKANRMFLYRKDMYSEWLAYGNDAKRIAQAFTAGINAYVRLTQKHPSLLPPEFDLLGYKPALWMADDVVRIRSNGLWRNVNTEVWRARLACQEQLSLAAKWKELEPSWQTKVPDGLDPCIIPEDVLRLYHLAKAPVGFASKNKTTAALQDINPLHTALGSNNWVVAGERTNTGRPILADDPHRGHAVPSLRYITHLVAPGINVIGAGEPALPGISIGHNETIAFGLTIFPIDQEDLYVYEKVGDEYRYNNHVVAFEEVEEKLSVAGGSDTTITMKFTRHGPVVAETKEHAFVVRAAWLEPGMSPYFGSIEYMRAENFREFVGALNRWGAPSENQVYADIQGNIGYKPAGRFPIRRNWDGLLPVPGNGKYEWQGYFDMDTLPEEYNPPRGFTGTANSNNLPKGYDIDEYRIGFEWSGPWRYKRLWEVLAEDENHTMDDSINLQRDYLSILAREVIAHLPELNQHKAGKLLTKWDFKLSTQSAAAAFWNVWYSRHLNPAIGALVKKQHGIKHAKSAITGKNQLDALTLLKVLKTPEGKAAALASLDTAYRETKKLLGNEMQLWQWGDLHKIKFAHPLLEMAHLDKTNSSLAKDMILPEYPRGGSTNTTNNTGYANDNFDVRSGASFRMVVDVGNWDAALATNAPGQSGDPRSKYYDNLLENWATDSQFQLLYSREKILENAAFTIKLDPQK